MLSRWKGRHIVALGEKGKWSRNFANFIPNARRRLCAAIAVSGSAILNLVERKVEAGLANEAG